MSFHTGQENRDIGAHKLGVWYELPHNEVPFMLLEPPQRVYKSELHTGPALLMDGRVVTLAWPPWTKLRPGPIARLVRRIGRALKLVAPRPLPPAELRRPSPAAAGDATKGSIPEAIGAESIRVSYEAPAIVDARDTKELGHG